VAIAIEEVICRFLNLEYKGMLLNTQKGKYWASEKVMVLWWVLPRQLLAAGEVTLSYDKSLDALVPAYPVIMGEKSEEKKLKNTQHIYKTTFSNNSIPQL
jgi:hypothetical protein